MNTVAKVTPQGLANTSQISSKKAVNRVAQSGVGLIEVMVALFILALGALAIANMQVSALLAIKISSAHFSLPSLGSEISEHLKADQAEAGFGTYNTTFDQLTADSSLSIEHAAVVNSWKTQVNSNLSAGATNIQCTTNSCTVSLRWNERSGNGSMQQFYNFNIPLTDVF